MRVLKFTYLVKFSGWNDGRLLKRTFRVRATGPMNAVDEARKKVRRVKELFAAHTPVYQTQCLEN